MKKLIIFLTLIFLTSCSSSNNNNDNANAARANLAARNKEISTRNEMVRLVQDAQDLEQAGRDLELYRKSQISIDSGACAKALKKKTAGIEDFQKRIETMPDNYKNQLMLIFEDLNKCLACEKTAIESCRKSRATINQVIKEVFP